jgi:ASCH domain
MEQIRQWRCLSIKQPYAYLIATGEKKIEYRKWNTKFRGEFLIHASQKLDMDALQDHPDLNRAQLDRGAIIGKAYLYDVEKHGDRSYWFLIREAARFSNPIPMKGTSYFFKAKRGAIDQLAHCLLCLDI